MNKNPAGINAIKSIQKLTWLDIKEVEVSDNEFINKKYQDMLNHFQDCIFQLNMKHCEVKGFDGTLLFDIGTDETKSNNQKE